MNTISSTRCNQPSFGKFQKPSKEVMYYFQQAITNLSKDERKTFVTGMDAIVKSNENCPVLIEHRITKGYTPGYGASVNDKVFNNTNMTGNTAATILCVMKNAAREAENKANIDENMRNIAKIFDIQA